MGLAGPRKRAKFSHDPNNTAWSRSTTSYGHKQLLSQGWKPGQTLGATDATHKKYHTVASASHIRVALKDDNLGLGAKRGSGQLEAICTGLDSFQNLLGRLNGKSEERLEQEQKGRDHFKRVAYVEQRWGGLNFVSGGLLVGDEIFTKNRTVEDDVKVSLLASTSNETPREVVMIADQALEAKLNKKSKDKVSKTQQRARCKTKSLPNEVETLQGRATGTNFDCEEPQDVDCDIQDDNEWPESKRRKAAKALRKAERAKRKLDKRKRKAAEQVNEEQSEQSTFPSVSTVAGSGDVVVPATGETLRLPARILGSRHAIRQRYIRQKKMALLDCRALNEILMVKV